MEHPVIGQDLTCIKLMDERDDFIPAKDDGLVAYARMILRNAVLVQLGKYFCGDTLKIHSRQLGCAEGCGACR